MATIRKDLGTARWKRLRLQVLARDGYTCAYCGNDATQVDHVVARSVGGEMYSMDNLVACCAACNVSKGNRGVFLRDGSTPPAFPDSSLPKKGKTDILIPKSPFIEPK